MAFLTMSPDGVRLLRELEGCASLPYRDVAGMWTLGIGHVLTQSELASGKIDVPSFGQCRYGRKPWPDAWIEVLLRKDLRMTCAILTQAVQVPVTQTQTDALLCWAFNVGGGAARHSTLLKVLNAGRYDDVPAQLRRWVFSGGRWIEGLTRRREREVALWERREP